MRREQKKILTPKQQAFVMEYVVDLNATQAAIRAGYSAKTAAEQGYDNLRKPQIAAAIAEAQAARLKKAELTADRVLEELRRIAFYDVRKHFHPGGSLKDAHEWDEENGSAIASTETTRKNLDAADGVVDVVTKIKVWDKLRALEILAKHFRLMTEVQEVEHKGAVVLMWKERPPKVRQ